jgi:hypothetical protein
LPALFVGHDRQVARLGSELRFDFGFELRFKLRLALGWYLVGCGGTRRLGGHERLDRHVRQLEERMRVPSRRGRCGSRG